MVIQVKNLVVKKPDEKIIKEEKLEKMVLENASKSYYSNTNTLIVNGKIKKIGKKSHYLIDMLTLDD